MFRRTIEDIFTRQALMRSLERYSSHKDYRLIYDEIDSKALRRSLIGNAYTPIANQRIAIEKSNGEQREIALSSLRSRVVQRTLADALKETFRFNDKSYAYQSGKGALKAFEHVKAFIESGYTYVVRVDIDNFFDTMDQQLLIDMLEKKLFDRRLVKMIATFISNGLFDGIDWKDKTQGIHQGDNLSPLLSNIYLDRFDRQLESSKIDFVRFSDDIVLFARSKSGAKKTLDKATRILSGLALRFDTKKSHIADLEEGFEYLGFYYADGSITIDSDRFEQKKEELKESVSDLGLEESIERLNAKNDGFVNYYSKVLTGDSQLSALQYVIDKIVIDKVVMTRQQKLITKKTVLRRLLYGLKTLYGLSKREHRAYIENLLTQAYARLESLRPLESAKRSIERKKLDFLKEEQKANELTLARHGLFAGYGRGKAMVKEYGKIVKSVPIKRLRRVVITAKVSISADLIYQCAQHGVAIDLIRNNRPFAMISYFKTISHTLYHQQHKSKHSDHGLSLAKAFVGSKAKNQTNLVKYFARYRKKVDPEQYLVLTSIIDSMEEIGTRVKMAKDQEMLMGFEGSLSVEYWKAFGILIEDEEYVRITRDAPDSVNQALNYGYAILYHRVQSALLDAGLNIYTSYLHEHQANKPTLVFDVIEEFRQFTVDKEIISMLSQNQPITTSKGKLTKKSVKAVTENIQERLASYVRWRKGRFQLQNIIIDQARQLAHSIENTTKYKGFVGRY